MTVEELKFKFLGEVSIENSISSYTNWNLLIQDVQELEKEMLHSLDKKRLLQIKTFGAKKFYDPKSNESRYTFFHYLAEWSEYVLSPQSDLFFIFRGLDKEDEVLNIIYEKEKREKFFPFFLEKERGKNFLLDLIDRWFLKRYDLETAKKILKTLDELSKESDEKEKITNKFRFSNVFNFCFLSSLVLFVILIFSYVLANNQFLISKYLVINDLVIQIILTIIYVLLLGIFLILLNKPNMIRRFIPRLFIATIIGYIPLLFGEEMWKFGYNADYKVVIAIFCICLGSAYLYLRFEVGNKIQDTSIVFFRTWEIFTRGITYSLMVGIIIQDIFCRYLLVSNENEKYFLFAGILGSISPKVLLVFFPLALLIGIFVQIIWEDKPITHPL